MAELVGVNPSTIGKAMNCLADKGLIVRRRRVGTFVAYPRAMTTGNIGFYYFCERQAITLASVEAMHRVLGPAGYDIKMIPYDNEFFSQTDLIADIKRRSLSGAIFTTLRCEECLGALKRLDEADFSYVIMSTRHHEGQIEAPLVVGHSGQAMEDTLAYLREKGHMAIGFVGCSNGDPQDVVYRKAMMNVPMYRQTWRLAIGAGPPIGHPLPHGRTLALGYLHQNPELTAVIAYHPLEANALVEESQIFNDCEKHLSIVCLQDWSQYHVPMLSSAWRLSPTVEGEKAAEILLKRIAGEQVPHMTRVECKWVDRASVKPLQCYKV